MTNNKKSISLKTYIDSDVEIDAIVPEKATLLENMKGMRVSKRTIVKLQGIFDDSICWSADKGFSVCRGEQYDGLRIVLSRHFENVKDDKGADYIDEEEYIFRISSDANCCEEWGSFVSEDDLQRFEGCELYDIYFTDTSLNTEQLRYIASLKDSLDYHNIQFINFKTSKGVFQFTVYNCHNGYYGHDITVTQVQNFKYRTIYSDKI